MTLLNNQRGQVDLTLFMPLTLIVILSRRMNIFMIDSGMVSSCHLHGDFIVPQPLVSCPLGHKDFHNFDRSYNFIVANLTPHSQLGEHV